MNAPRLAIIVPRRVQSTLTRTQLKNYCDRLGVPLQASEAKIKQAYYKKSLLHHPDRNQGDEKSVILFAEINEAYQALIVNKRDSQTVAQDFSNRWKFKSNNEFRSWHGRRNETKRGPSTSWQNVHPEDEQKTRDHYMATSNDTKTGWYGQFYSDTVARDFATHKATRERKNRSTGSRDSSCIVM